MKFLHVELKCRPGTQVFTIKELVEKDWQVLGIWPMTASINFFSTKRIFI